MTENSDPTKEILEDEKPSGAAGGPLYWLWDLVKTWGPALLTVLVIRSVVAEPFRIPSGSMVPTLEIGDFILVSKFAYGIRFPFTPYKLVPLGLPERGDIIVFKYPSDPSLDYIKRVVGVPGDEISVKENVLYVNGVKQEKQYLDRFLFTDDRCEREDAKLFEEEFSGVKHLILNSVEYPHRIADFGPYKVEPESVFVMGDNRDNSHDSRRWGPVPAENIKGRAILVWLSLDQCKGSNINSFHIGRPRLDRVGTMLR